MDPLAEISYEWSPYAYVGNNPLKFVDPDGRKIVIYADVKVGRKWRTETFVYTQSGVINARTNQTVNFSENSHVGQIVNGYNKMLSSGNSEYVKQVTTLIESKNIHEINANETGISGVSAGTRGENTKESQQKAKKGESVSTYTTYNFSEKYNADDNVEKSNYTTVSHEVQHQYDYETGNMKDDTHESKASNPAEKRAVKNEDYAREQKKFKRRTTYDGVSIY